MSSNLDSAIEYVKNIVNAVRCVFCDGLTGDRYRQPCGHISCCKCIDTTFNCSLCLTPPDGNGSWSPVRDAPWSDRVQHINNLLITFEDTFQVDVSKRQRISDQLKNEKIIFPDCIQALHTYENKHKTKQNHSKHKENKNKRVFPGEVINVSNLNKMDSSKSYVQKWLDQHESDLFKYEPRKPFLDLDANSPRFHSTPIKKHANVIQKKVKTKHKTFNKSSFKKSLKANNQSGLKSYLKPSSRNTWKSVDRSSRGSNLQDKISKQQSSKEESGIVIDDTIVIEDSQSQKQDKDELAWLAVLEANEETDAESVCNSKQSNIVEPNLKGDEPILITDTESHSHIKVPRKEGKVPFLKRGSLRETCHRCKMKNLVAGPSKTKDVSIKIETDVLVTTITVKRCGNMTSNQLESKSVQTENIIECTNFIDLRNYPREIEDLFTAEAKTAVNKQVNKHTDLLVINDSSSESSTEHEKSLTVTAEVHKSCDNILKRSVLSQLSEVVSRRNPTKRSHSPDSSNSSNKENYDPNVKKRKTGKKIKKNRQYTSIKSSKL